MRIIKLINPLLVYTFIWTVTVLLIHLEITRNILPLTGDAALIIYASILISTLLYIIYGIFSQIKVKPTINVNYFRLLKITNVIYYSWITIVLIYFYNSGIGLLNIYNGVYVDHTETQITSLWGLIITFDYFLACSYYYILLKTSIRKTIKTKLLTLLAFPLLIFSRNVILQMSFQLLCIHILNKKDLVIDKRNFFKFALLLLLSLVLFIVAFGLIGDYRTVGGKINPYSDYVNLEYLDLMELLPTGATWLYIYITSGYNNIIYGIDYIKPTYSLIPIIFNVIPGVLKDYFLDPGINTVTMFSEFILDPSMNVCSFFAGPIKAFGTYGAIFVITLVLLFSMISYKFALIGTFGSQLIYSTLFACIFFTVFYDAFFTVSTIFQVLIGLALEILTRINSDYAKI